MGRSSKTSASESMSMNSAKKARNKTRASEAQGAGQPSGGPLSRSARTSERAKSRSAIERGDGETIAVAAAGINIASCTVGLLHAIDVGLGVALVIYGGLVHVTAVMAVTISYGLVLLLGALAGAIGYFSGACSRRCLRASATAAFLTSILDIGAFIAILVSWDSFVGFLDENYEHLMLSEDSVKVIQGLKIPLAVIFAVLAGLEVLRGFAMWGMKDNFPGQVARVTPHSRSTSVSKRNWFLSSFGLTKRKKTDDFVVFDDNASMESSLLWSQDRAQPASGDFLDFISNHERGLADFSKVPLQKPPEDNTDY